jgi:competence protein ComGF
MNIFSKKIVALVLILNIAFTIAILYLFCRMGSEPTSLIVAWFSFTTVELWSLSKITREKVKSEGRDESGD